MAFVESINKQFVIGGTEAGAAAGAMVQLTQAMGSGALRGDELNSVLEAAPSIARNIEKYMGMGGRLHQEVCRERHAVGRDGKKCPACGDG